MRIIRYNVLGFGLCARVRHEFPPERWSQENHAHAKVVAQWLQGREPDVNSRRKEIHRDEGGESGCSRIMGRFAVSGDKCELQVKEFPQSAKPAGVVPVGVLGMLGTPVTSVTENASQIRYSAVQEVNPRQPLTCSYIWSCNGL